MLVHFQKKVQIICIRIKKKKLFFFIKIKFSVPTFIENDVVIIKKKMSILELHQFFFVASLVVLRNQKKFQK